MSSCDASTSIGAASTGGSQGWLGYLASMPMYLAESAFSWASGTQRKRANSLFLQGNFAPVSEELYAEDLDVVGNVPADLSGCFLRIGPNPSFTPVGGYHWFDGDGMVHACRIKDGKVGYSNRWVHTNRFKQEHEIGWPAFTKIGDLEGVTGLVAMGMGFIKTSLGIISTKGGSGTGNTAMAFHANRLLALQEADMPYALRVACEGIVETLSRVRYEGYSSNSFTAHPKVDPVTKKLHIFNYSLQAPPYLTYSVADADGNLEMSVPISIESPVMMHDFAITENYAVFLDVPLLFDPKVMVKEGKLPFVFDRERGTRFGLRRFDAPRTEEAVRWFAFAASRMIFHVANAFEDGDKVHLYACAMRDFDLSAMGRPAPGADKASTQPMLVHYVFDLKSGSATETTMSSTSCEFPQIDSSLVGRRNRFVFAAVVSGDGEEDSTGNEAGPGGFRGIAKFDLLCEGSEAGQDACCGTIAYGPGSSGGEVIFVKRQGGSASAEDDGYLLAFVYDENSDKSDFVVYDASTMSNEPLATVHLPKRIPYGFHALFMSEEQVQSQKAP